VAYTTLNDITITNTPSASDAHYRAIEAVSTALAEMAIAARELACSMRLPAEVTGIRIAGDHITNNNFDTSDKDTPTSDEDVGSKEPGPWSSDNVEEDD
jgi:hypothetical protein